MLRAEYLNYDDDVYITANPYIRQLNAHSVQTLFTTRYENQYAPVAMLIMAAEFKLFGGALPALRWVTILVHLANVLLRFGLVWMLFRNFQVAFITAALFGVHPMQVESVAWITANMKVGWYVLFSLASLVAYVRYARSRRVLPLVASLILFALSCLSKEQGVALVATLPLIDYVLARDLRGWPVWLEKLPFVAIAVAIGSVTLRAAGSQRGLEHVLPFDVGDRLILMCYAFTSCLAKLAAPVRLSAFYTYPVHIPGVYALAPLVVLAVLAALVLAWRRGQRVLVFGIAFFLTHLVLTLANLMFGLRDALMADRYVYLPAAGAFLLLAYGFHQLQARAPWLRTLLGATLAVYVAGLGFAAHARANVWRNSLTLLSDVIQKETAARGRDNPHLAIAYNNHGVALKNLGDAQAALADFNEAIRINPGDTRAYVNRGNYYFNRQDYARALPDYDRAIERKPDNEIAYSNRGGLLASTGQLDRALTDFDHALQLKPYFLDAIRGRALVFYAQRQYDRALKDCEHYVALNPTADMLGLRGLAYQGLGRAREAEADLTRAIQLDPKAPGYYRDRSLLYSQLGDRTRALQDARIAQSLGAPIDSAYLRSLE